jgi:hypothetical protein
VAGLLAIGLVACGGDSLSSSEYAVQLEDEVAAMNARLDQIDAELERAASVDEASQLWDERIAARQRFVDYLETIDPPASASELHAAAYDILGRLVEAEAAMGVLASEYEAVASLGQIWNTSEGQAARAVDQEAVAICRAAQASFDESADREVLADVSWVTSDMKEVIDVVFGCTAEERRTTP